VSYFDVGAVVLIFGIFVYAHVFLATEPLEFLRRFFGEFADLANRNFGQTGAINALGLVIVAFFGLFILVKEITESLVAMALSLIDSQHAHAYAASVNLVTLFLALAMLAALSTLLTLLQERRP
jgi:hypothetical protein